MSSGIYQITNSINDKVYIGSSVNLVTRKRDHFKTLRKNKHQNQHLQNAFNKYGESCFDFSILHECDIDMLIVFEQYFIDDYLVSRLYNIRKFAASNQGNKHTAETKRKIGTIHTGNTYNLGRKHTAESRSNMSKAHIGYKQTAEHIANTVKAKISRANSRSEGK